MTSSRPYLLRAIYEWIADNNWTPHIVVDANAPHVQVPQDYVQEGKIILNISADATQKLIMNNNAVEFDARFGGDIWHINVPVSAVLAIYARENGRGMVFDEEITDGDGGDDDGSPIEPDTSSTTTSGKPNLKVVK